jgi:hypothetical protein
MSKRRTDPEWREFERLVARIEADARNTGLTIRSPDHIRCRLTGAMREVDASIRGGSEFELITIECRKRRAREDVTWIEQLATKKESIGAARTIAVSASGFSKAAQTVAASHGIELKTLRDISLADINPVAKLDFVWFSHKTAVLDSVGLRYFRSLNWQLPERDSIDFILPADTDLFEPIFTNVDEGHSWSINDIWYQLQETTEPFAGIAKFQPPVVRTACFPYPGNVRVSTPHGPEILGDVFLSVALSLDVEQVTLEAATKVEYGASQADDLQRAEFVSSRHESTDWRVSLQLPKNATNTSELRTGGNWPANSPGDLRLRRPKSRE